MSNLFEIAEHISHKLNKKAQAAEKKQDKLVFALEHLDAAAQMLAEEGNHLMSEAVTELMEKAVKVAEEDPDINKGDVSQEKYLIDLLQDATNDLVTLLESGINDEEGPPISYEQKQYLLKKNNIPELQKDLYQLDLELGQATHPSDTSGMLSVLLQLALYIHRKYLIEWIGRGEMRSRMPESIKKLDKIKDTVLNAENAAWEHYGENLGVDKLLEYMEDSPTGLMKNMMSKTLNSMMQEDIQPETERFKEHEHLPSTYRNRMEEALEQAHQESMPEDVRERDYYDYEPELEVRPKYDDTFDADDAQQLKDLW